jgi:hypothetical protein
MIDPRGLFASPGGLLLLLAATSVIAVLALLYFGDGGRGAGR